MAFKPAIDQRINASALINDDPENVSVSVTVRSRIGGPAVPVSPDLRGYITPNELIRLLGGEFTCKVNKLGGDGEDGVEIVFTKASRA